MTGTVPPQRTAAAIAARRATAEQLVENVKAALAQMRRERARITVRAVERRAGVSRAFLYQNEQARALIRDAAQAGGQQRTQDREDQAARVDAGWRERALNAEDALKTAGEEIRTLRRTIGELLGKIADLEGDLPEDAVQRLQVDNSALRRQIRDLTAGKKDLEQRLAASRANNRHQDKKLADLEIALLDQGGRAPGLRPVR